MARPSLRITRRPAHRGFGSTRGARSGHARYGFKASFNQTFAVPDSPTGWWVTPYHFGIDQGPVILMLENYRTGPIWQIVRRCPYVKAGLLRAGFRGGWL